uniref:Uncharacterized protein n=1 Tax=Romanomermis culicivorax TaxID=13658 RepID=A0A915JCG8_ROMCU
MHFPTERNAIDGRKFSFRRDLSDKLIFCQQHWNPIYHQTLYKFVQKLYILVNRRNKFIKIRITSVYPIMGKLLLEPQCSDQIGDRMLRLVHIDQPVNQSLGEREENAACNKVPLQQSPARQYQYIQSQHGASFDVNKWGPSGPPVVPSYAPYSPFYQPQQHQNWYWRPPVTTSGTISLNDIQAKRQKGRPISYPHDIAYIVSKIDTVTIKSADDEYLYGTVGDDFVCKVENRGCLSRSDLMNKIMNLKVEQMIGVVDLAKAATMAGREIFTQKCELWRILISFCKYSPDTLYKKVSLGQYFGMGKAFISSGT